MKTKHILSLPILICALFVSQSCQKDTNTIPSESEQEEFAVATTQSHAESEVVFNDVFDNVIGVNAEVAIGGTGVFGGMYPSGNGGSDSPNGPSGADSTRCFVVTATNLQQGSFFPVRIEIDFGAGCTGRDGRTRKGKIITTYSSRLIFPGATATTTFEDYSVNGIKVEGTHLITNKTSNNVPAFEVNVNGKLTKANGNYSEWVSVRNVVQVGGLNTIFAPGDDVLEISGAASGTVKRGEKLFQWSTASTTPLVKKFSCRWIVMGSLSFKKGNLVVATLDYGSGDCDNEASLNVNGSARIITLD